LKRARKQLRLIVAEKDGSKKGAQKDAMDQAIFSIVNSPSAITNHAELNYLGGIGPATAKRLFPNTP
jgi:hypothetical protein